MGPQGWPQGAALVPHAKLPLDHHGDPRQSPALGIESSRSCAPLEHTQELPPLRLRQPRGPAGTMALAQAPQPVVLQSQLPARHGRPTDAHPTCDLRLGQLARAQEPSRSKATLFQLGRGQTLWLPHRL